MRLNKEVKRELAKMKNDSWERKCEELDRHIGGTKIAEGWKTIRNLRKNTKETSKLSLISLNEWKSYYEKLLTEGRSEYVKSTETLRGIEDQSIERISKEEVERTVKEMRNGKSPGPGDIPIELMKHGPSIVFEVLTKIINTCLIEGEALPDDWNVAYISSIYKKGNKKICISYRGISVTSAIGRLYGRILKQRIEEQVTDIEEQSGFRAGRSCTDNVFTLRQLVEKRTARNLSTHLVFVDLEKAYDSVPLCKLYDVLAAVGLNQIYI